MNQKCKGCNFLYKICLIRFSKKLVDNCPCTICLVKSMCKTACYRRMGTFSSLPVKSKDALIKDYYNEFPDQKDDFKSQQLVHVYGLEEK